jgi:TRAP-type C4-dicarboxylate transport system permease small subunit
MNRPRYSPEGTASALVFVALFVVILIQVLGRTPLFTGPVWTEELARWLWVWMAMLGFAEVERADLHLRMGFLADALPAGLRRALATVLDLVWLGVAGHLVWIGWRTVLRTWNNEATTLPVSDAVLYAAALVMAVLVVHRVVRRVIGRFLPAGAAR